MTEVDALKKRIIELECALGDAIAFVEIYADVEDGDDGQPEPNAAMALMQYLDEALAG